jgi:WD40 repeat protein
MDQNEQLDDNMDDLVEVEVLEEGEEIPFDDGEADNGDAMMVIEEGDEAAEEAEGEAIDDCYFTFEKHTDSVCCVAVHPFDICLIATGGCDDIAYLWHFPSPNSNSSEEVWFHQFSGHTDTVTSVGFNFNGKLLLTGSYDGTVMIWDIGSKERLQLLEGPEDIEWATWHTKGNAVLAGSKDGTVWLWLSHNGQCLQVFAGDSFMFESVFFFFAIFFTSVAFVFIFVSLSYFI